LSVQQSENHSVATMFRLVQHSRSDTDDALRKTWNHISDLVNENLSGKGSLGSMPSNQARNLPYSLFSVKFSVLSSMIVLEFLESRIPGLLFLNYKRNEGSPQLDHVLFGPYALSLCDHPFCMKIHNSNGSSTGHLGSALFGYDLRLIKDFSARPIIDEDGASSFHLTGPSMEKVASWWVARKPLQERIKAFMGPHPKSDITDMPLLSSMSSRMRAGGSFIEGVKNPDPVDDGHRSKAVKDPRNLPMSDHQTAVARASHQPDLKDVDVLLASRAVVVDLGNACWTHKHFSEDIQTRQYRAPEVLIGHRYDTSADMWSLGCMTFELLTGDLLFDPREGPDYDRDEDHIAMFQELLGKIPKKMACTGKYSKNFFDRKGNLKHIKQLKYWPLESVLNEKYHFAMDEAKAVADFIVPLLDYDTKTRSTALQCLQHKWLDNVD